MKIEIVLPIICLGIGLVGCSSRATPPRIDATVAEQAAVKAQEAANRAAAANKNANNAETSAPADLAKTVAAKK